MIISKITHNDRELLKRIYLYEKQIFGEASIGRYNVSPFTKYGAIFAIYDDENIYSVVEVIYSPKNIAYIYGVSTNIEFRRQNFARRLMNFVFENIKDWNISSYELTVTTNNEKAISLYESLNFKKIKILKNEYFDGEDKWLMRKEV